MNKEEAIAKVRRMQALGNSTDFEGERGNAEQAILALRLRHGISDADLDNPASEEPDTDVFGFKLFHYSHQIRPHVVAIADEIDRVLAKIAQESPQQRLQDTCTFYSDVRALVESKAAGRPYINRKVVALQDHRDEAVKAYYASEKEAYRKTHHGMGYKPDEIMVHNHARDYTAIYSDLRKDHIERIVGVTEKGLWAPIIKRMQEEKAAEDAAASVTAPPAGRTVAEDQPDDGQDHDEPQDRVDHQA